MQHCVFVAVVDCNGFVNASDVVDVDDDNAVDDIIAVDFGRDASKSNTMEKLLFNSLDKFMSFLFFFLYLLYLLYFLPLF